MDIQTKIILCLAIVDAVIIAVFYLWLRSSQPMDDKAFTANCAGLAMFVIQAVFCSRGWFLIAQMATIATIFALCWLQHLGKISRTSPDALK